MSIGSPAEPRTAQIELQQEAEETLRSKTLLQKALWRLWHDRLTLLAGSVILILAAMCFSAPLIVDYLMDIDYNSSDLYNNNLPPGARVSDSDTTVYQWLSEEGELRRSFIAHIQPVHTVAFGPEDSDLFVTGSDDGSVRIWHIPTGRARRLLEEHTAPITAVAFNQDSSRFLTASEDGTAKLWDTEKSDRNAPDVPVTIFEQGSPVTAAALASGRVLTASDNGTLRLWEAESGALTQTFDSAHEGRVHSVALSADGNTAVSGGADGSAILWNLVSGEQRQTFAHDGGAVLSVALSPDQSLVLTGSDDNNAYLWDTSEGSLIATWDAHEGAVNGVEFGAEGDRALTASSDGTTILWNVSNGEIVHRLDEQTYPVYDVSISPDGASIITTTEGKRRFYLLGTDTSGRDHFSRLLYGGQVSLQIGFFAAVGALTIGIIIGVATGYIGGVFDDFVIWVITTLDSIPSLFLLLIISAVLAPNATSLILVLVFLGWTGATRLVRGETFSLREREFVLAARATGASSIRIMFVHIAPNVISLLLIVLSRSIGGLILAESTLSFLGFGVKPPTPTWGNMLSSGLQLLRDAPHLVFAPGLLITVTVLCLYVMGDGLRDAFDPRTSD